MLVLWLNINSPTQFMVSFIAYNNKGPERFAPSLYISYLNKKKKLISLQDMLQWCGVLALLW